MKRPGSVWNGAIPAVASAVLPGLGQLINGEGSKALGVFAVAAAAGLLSTVPLIGGVAWLAYGATWIYGVADGYFTGRNGKG